MHEWLFRFSQWWLSVIVENYQPGVYFIRFGKKVAMLGNKTKSMIRRTCIPINGRIPLNIVPIGISGAQPEMTKTLIPTGGVICPISIIITMTTPNQMGSKPA